MFTAWNIWLKTQCDEQRSWSLQLETQRQLRTRDENDTGQTKQLWPAAGQCSYTNWARHCSRGVPQCYWIERHGKCRRRGMSLRPWIWTQIIRICRAVGAIILTCLYQSAVISAPTPVFRLSCCCTSLHISLTHAKAMQVTTWHLPRATPATFILVALCGRFLHRSKVHQLPCSDKCNDAGKYQVQISLWHRIFSAIFFCFSYTTLRQCVETEQDRLRLNRYILTTHQHLPVSLHTAQSVQSIKLHQHFIYLYIQVFTAVAVFRKPNAIPLCFSIDLALNFLLSWLLVLLPSTFFLDVLFPFSPAVSNP